MTLQGDKSIPEIIAVKRDGGEFSERDIESFVSRLVSGDVSDSQLGAWLMATYLHGLSVQETAWLTQAMVQSGDSMEWPNQWRHLCVDKHSTGGVGDKVSLPLAPALAACGLKVPMISGRGLGITGGTLDKLESIPGYKVNLTLEEICSIVEDVGCCIAGQTQKLCPADKTMYAARDITNTVGCLGLIVSSIISKKAAEGINQLVLDVKWGEGCYQETKEQAEKLADVLVQTSENVGVRTTAVISHMESPLGKCVGNSLEVEESIQCLRGYGSRDLRQLVMLQGGLVLVSSGLVTSLEEGERRIRDVLDNGKALEKFRQMIVRQGVDKSLADKLCQEYGDNNNTVSGGERLTASSTSQTSLKTETGGIVTKIGAGAVARLAISLGAGRSHPGDNLDLTAGVELMVEPGDQVISGQVWAIVHHNKEIQQHLLAELEKSIKIDSDVNATVLPRITKVNL